MKFKDVRNMLRNLGAEFNHMKKAKDLIAKLKEFEAEIDAILDRKIEEFLEDYKDSENPLLIYVQGYTPLWNDGEACEHWSEYGVGVEKLIREEWLFNSDDFFKDYISNIEDLDYDSDVEDIEGTFAEPDDEVEEIVKELILPALEKKYGTDYQALIVCHQGKITVKQEDWNPEW